MAKWRVGVVVVAAAAVVVVVIIIVVVVVLGFNVGVLGILFALRSDIFAILPPSPEGAYINFDGQTGRTLFCILRLLQFLKLRWPGDDFFDS